VGRDSVPFLVIPAKAGIQAFWLFFNVDASFRWHDDVSYIELSNYVIANAPLIPPN